MCKPVLPVMLSIVLGFLAGCGGDPPDTDAIRAAEWNREPASPVLIEAATDGSDPVAQRRAVVAIGRIQSPSYVPALVDAATDPAVRGEALFALGQLGLTQGQGAPPAAANDACRAALDDDDPATVAGAVECVGKLALHGNAETIVPFLRHDDPAVRVEAAHALMRCRFAPTWRGEVPRDAPPPLPEAATFALIAAFEDPDPAVRQAAVHVFSRYGDPAASEALVPRIYDEDPATRVFALRALAKSGGDAVAVAAAGGEADADLHVRTEAVRTLDTLDREDLIGASLAGDISFHVRAAVADALGDPDDGASLQVLHGLEDDPSPTVRGAALVSLTERHGASYLASRWDGLASEPWPVRVAGTVAAGTLGDAADTFLLQAAGDPDPRVRAAAVAGLGPFLDRGEIVELVSASLIDDDLAVRGTAVELIAASDLPDRTARLFAVYDASPGTTWIEIRETIVNAVAEVDGADEFLLQVATADDAPSVRARARIALATRDVEPPPDPAADAPVEPPVPIGAWDEPPVIALETNRGTIAIETYPDAAPLHVSSFVTLVEDGTYDGLPWHRVVPNFVIQGGDPLGNGWGGAGYTLPDEISRLRYERGVVGMPKAGKDTGSCQIFATHVPTPHLDGNYTVYGRVIEGLDVVDRIEVGDVIERAYVR